MIPAWLAQLNVGVLMAWIAGILVVLAAARRAWNFVAPLVRMVREFLEDWRGEAGRPGYPGRPGVPERLLSIERTLTDQDGTLARITHELHPNSGGSLRDQVDTTNRRLEQHLLGNRTEVASSPDTAMPPAS